MAVVHADVSAAIGRTPLVRLPRLSAETGVELLAKLEWCNPAGSVKDRVARAMVLAAEARGELRPGAAIVEPTSGNTGIALAMIAAARGYVLYVTMPEAMSQERVALLRGYGAEVVLTPGALMRQAVEQAELLAATLPGAVMLRQFDNPANPAEHERSTAEEIWQDAAGAVDVFVAGIGTGGTVSGVGRVLKRRRPGVRVVGVEPAAAAVLSGGAVGSHGIQGLGAGFVPRNLDRAVLDEIIAVRDDEAFAAVRRLAARDGVFGGLSSGAALAAAMRVASRPEMQGKRMVVVLPDSAERYLSTLTARATG